MQTGATGNDWVGKGLDRGSLPFKLNCSGSIWARPPLTLSYCEPLTSVYSARSSVEDSYWCTWPICLHRWSRWGPDARLRENRALVHLASTSPVGCRRHPKAHSQQSPRPFVNPAPETPRSRSSGSSVDCGCDWLGGSHRQFWFSDGSSGRRHGQGQC